jgi:ABC-type cobalamin transport system ATPase subunit
MPHESKHDVDFADYAKTRRQAIRGIKELRAYLSQLEAVALAMPVTNEDAGYLDLDNIEQIAGDISEAVDSICDWDSLGDDFSRLGLLVKQDHPTTSTASAAK